MDPHVHTRTDQPHPAHPSLQTESLIEELRDHATRSTSSPLISISGSQIIRRLSGPSSPYDTGFQREFYTLAQEDEETFDKRRCTDGFDNDDFNRYADVLPYNDTRVRIAVSPHDYINASHVLDAFHGAPDFITAQGPLPSTNYDFWRMVLEQRAGIIVMLTNIIENNIIKCEQYWPEYGATLTYDLPGGGAMEIQMVDEAIGMAWCRRQFRITERVPKRFVLDHDV